MIIQNMLHLDKQLVPVQDRKCKAAIELLHDIQQLASCILANIWSSPGVSDLSISKAHSEEARAQSHSGCRKHAHQLA